uniref:Uncharacterized protein n=1 Tax=Knipowitschia caucasica TaxID=637954 RepID=A0AAV2LV85_KNICA
MLWMKWRMVLGSLFGWRRRWLLLLFTAGTLIVIYHQQDRTVQQQSPDEGVRVLQSSGAGKSRGFLWFGVYRLAFSQSRAE